MLIFCSGMPRSASTWAYNVCRLLLSQNPSRSLVAGFVGEWEDVDDYLKKELTVTSTTRNILLKTHVPGPLSVGLIQSQKAKHLYTYRDPRDSLCSYLAFEGGNFENVLEGNIRNLQRLNWYELNSQTLFIRYENMRCDTLQEIRRIANYLGLSLSEEVYQHIAEQTSLEASRKVMKDISKAETDQVFQEGTHTIDRVTLLHDNHISKARGKTGRWQDEFSVDQKLKANVALEPWLIDLGYETKDSFHHLLTSIMYQTDWQYQARKMISQEEYSQAITLYECGIVAEPTITSYYWYMGLAYFLMNQHEEAQATWLAGISQIAELDMDQAIVELTEIFQAEIAVQDNKGNTEIASQLKLAMAELTA
jgi:hypothetical protein